MTEQEKAERAEIAAKMLQAYIILNDNQTQNNESRVVDAVWMADRLIEELEK